MKDRLRHEVIHKLISITTGKMKTVTKRLRKTLIIVSGSLIGMILVILLLISPIARHFAIKYGEKFTGRHIEIGWLVVNPFTGYVYLSNLKIYEPKGIPGAKNADSVFLSANGVSADFAMLKLFSKTIEISEMTLYQPWGIIIQNEKQLNFSDLINLFKSKTPGKPHKGIRFSLLNLTIKHGEFHYRDEVAHISYFLKSVDIKSTGVRWNADTLAADVSFLSGPASGSLKGHIMMNFKTLEYKFTAVVKKYDLGFMEQYLKDLTNYGTFRANFDADLSVKGNFTNGADLNARGMLTFNDFHFGKDTIEDYLSFDKLVLQIDELSPLNHRYLFDSLSLTHPYFKYELYDHLDNLQMMFGKKGSNISDAHANQGRFNLVLEIAHFVKVVVQNFLQSYYRINRLAIYKGDLQFRDFSTSEEFLVGLNPLTIIADSLDKNHKRVHASIKSGVSPYGDISIDLSINPVDAGDFDLQYHLKHLPVSLFNPYLVTFTSFPLDRGSIEFNGVWNVRNGMIQSVNHLVLIDPRVSNRLKNKDKSWLPMPLIMAFIRERGNVIDYEIPITGNLKDPKFHLHDAIIDLVKNIFIKPSTTAYRREVRNTESEIEKSVTLKWEVRQGILLPGQEKFLAVMAEFLVKHQDATIDVYPMQYSRKEKEYILFYEAKKKYYMRSSARGAAAFSEEDSLKVDRMSVKDSLFVRYITEHAHDSMLFTIQQKCANYLGSDVVNRRYKQLNAEREATFMTGFKKEGVEARVHIHQDESTIPFNGFSYYKIAYKGEFPESLLKAYQKMNELNNEPPRKKFKKDRKKNKSSF
jgi:hypothetical protein